MLVNSLNDIQFCGKGFCDVLMLSTVWVNGFNVYCFHESGLGFNVVGSFNTLCYYESGMDLMFSCLVYVGFVLSINVYVVF